jgi:uncharacterized protein YjiS (DUF1127 family)
MMRDSRYRIAAKPRENPRERVAAESNGLLAPAAAIGAHRSADGARTKPSSDGGRLRHLTALIKNWLQRHVERRRLQSLNDHMLGDIGLSRRDIERELRMEWNGE